MLVHKFLCLTVTLFSIYKESECDNHLMKSVYLKCEASTNFFFPNYTCYARSQNRSFSAVNGYTRSREPVYEVWVRLHAYFYQLNTSTSTIYEAGIQTVLQIRNDLS